MLIRWGPGCNQPMLEIMGKADETRKELGGERGGQHEGGEGTEIKTTEDSSVILDDPISHVRNLLFESSLSLGIKCRLVE